MSSKILYNQKIKNDLNTRGIRIIRKANEGFVSYEQKTIKSKNTITGCFAFIEKVNIDNLIYNYSVKKKNEEIKDRTNEQEHTIYVSGGTKVWVPNVFIPHGKGIIKVKENDEEQHIYIKEENIDNSLDRESFVEITAEEAYHRLVRLHSIKAKYPSYDYWEPTFHIEQWKYYECVINTNQANIFQQV